MINLITGLPGSGKTLYTLKTVHDYAEKENAPLIAQGKPVRQVYYHGIPELTLPNWTLMDSPENWINLPSGSIIVIDECQSTFRPRAASVKPPPYIAEFETHRHKGLDFFLLTQHPMLLDGNIRRLAGKHYHVVRFYGFPKSTIHEFQSVRDNVDKNTKNSIATHFVYPKEVFKWYKSSDMHTMKKRVPMRVIMVIVLPILAIVAGYYAYQSIVQIQTSPKEELTKISQSPEAHGMQPTQSTVQPTIQKVNTMTYQEARTPVVEGLAHTAPIYAEITKPVKAPYPAACLMSKSKGCQCYSDTATKLNVPLPVCMTIVKEGIYIDWEQDHAKPLQTGDGPTAHDGGSAPMVANTV